MFTVTQVLQIIKKNYFVGEKNEESLDTIYKEKIFEVMLLNQVLLINFALSCSSFYISYF